MKHYRHIVLFWLKDPSPESIASARVQLLSLKEKIPGIVSFEVETDDLHTERSCDLCLNAVFDAKSSFETYRTHPEHLPVIAYMKEHGLKSKTADFHTSE